MYYKISKESETGQKLTAVLEKMKEAHYAIVELSEKMGFNKWRSPESTVKGGIDVVYFPKNKRPKSIGWNHNEDGSSYPNRRYKAGKNIAKMFQNLPRVSRWELNQAVGLDSAFNQIGFHPINDLYVVNIDEKWNHTMPEDCIEITVTEFKSL